MKIAKPLLIVSTPVGVLGGIYQGYQLAGGLVFLMVALLAMIGTAFALTVATIRREAAAEKLRASAPTSISGSSS